MSAMGKEQIIKEVESKLEQTRHEVLALLHSIEIEKQEAPPIQIAEVERQVTVEQAAEHLGITERQLRQMVADNYKNIPYYRPSERVLRFKLSELDAWSKRNADSKRLKAVS